MSRKSMKAVVVALWVNILAGASGGELLSNTGFEAGLDGWKRNGEGNLLWFNSGHTGAKSCLHQNRTAANAGPYQIVTTALNAQGKGYYQASAWLYQASGAAINARIELGVKDAGGWIWTNFPTSVPHDSWTQLSATVNLTWSGTVTEAWFVVNTVSSTTQIYVDDCSFQRMAAATPTIDPNGGAYVGSKSVTLECATTDASIYYTTNGIDPTTSSTLYEAPFTLTHSATVKALAVKSDLVNSAVASAAFSVTAAPAVIMPTLTPNGGSSVESVEVTLACATEEATIGYTTDGSTPTHGSTVYADPFTLTSNTTVKAIAWKSGLEDSEVASATFTVAVVPPTISPSSQSFRNSIAVSLACVTPGATITYTTDGNPPTPSSSTYSIPFAVTSTTTVKAMAWKNGMADSTAASAVFTAVPPESFINGSFEEGTNGWSITSSNPLAYAIASDHGSTDGALSLVIGAAQLAVNSSFAQTLATIAGGVYTLRFDYGGFGNSGPLQSLQAEALDGALAIASTNVTATGKNNFTTTGTTFAARTLVFTAVSSTTEIRFTDLTSNTFNCDGVLDKVRISGAVALPTVSPNGGSYYDTVDVSLTCSTPGVTITYTLDGSTPTPSSAVYSTPFALTSTATVKALAVLNGLANSDVVTAEFTVEPAPATIILVR